MADWTGRVVLLNLWATWCAPCRHEMPSLNQLQVELGSDQFEVVALSVDRKGLPASAKFLKETGASALKLYNDKSADSLQDLKVIGLPATLLIDRQGPFTIVVLGELVTEPMGEGRIDALHRFPKPTSTESCAATPGVIGNHQRDGRWKSRFCTGVDQRLQICAASGMMRTTSPRAAGAAPRLFRLQIPKL